MADSEVIEIELQLFQVDAFTSRRFAGNPAAVMVCPEFPDDRVMQQVAAENNLSETAFISPAHGGVAIRWFTPTVEVPLCGHATLASAAVVLERLEPGRSSVRFSSASGPLIVRREGSGYAMDLPARDLTEVVDPPSALPHALGLEPAEVMHDGFNYVARLHDARQVRELRPRLDAIADLEHDGVRAAGVVVTAAGDEGFDVVSRYFAPAKGIPEDPVTGGAHCALIPYWTRRLAVDVVQAYQASARGGELVGRMLDDHRVELVGGCVFYLEGVAQL